MLVLVSFGLVLLATILLVVGLLNDDGLTLIYFSIAASAAAAVVLYLAFRRARPQDDATADAPAPLDHDTEPEPVDATTVSPGIMSGTPAAPAPPPPAPPAPEPDAEPEPAPAPEPAQASGDDQWADDADWEVDDLEFPIADYDDLSVAEIMPLLPQLYSDELDIVYEREQATKNRSTILARLDKLKETGTEADAVEADADDEPTDDELTEEEVAEAPPTVITPAPVPAAPQPAAVSLLDDNDDDGAFFPIADYDDLSVSQIVPLLSQLELDELEDVRAREQAGANRATLLTEIDRYLSGELEPFTWSDDDGDAAAEPAGVVQPVGTQPTPAPGPGAERDRLPIGGYDQLTVADIRPRLARLSTAQLEQVLEYEQARDNRSTIVNDIRKRLDAEPEAPPAPAPRRAAAKRAPAKKAAAAKATARKATAKKAAKKARKATKKAAAARFPIANYDELGVAAIRPRLARLSDDQLRQVRQREVTGAGRKTILNDIDSRLG